jgi:hypothetical protein
MIRNESAQRLQQKKDSHMSLPLPLGFGKTNGDSIHTHPPKYPLPHLTGTLQGETVHIPYHGQTTLGMFDRKNLPGHRLGDVENLHRQFPNVFKNSGLKF